MLDLMRCVLRYILVFGLCLVCGNACVFAEREGGTERLRVCVCVCVDVGSERRSDWKESLAPTIGVDSVLLCCRRCCCRR